MTEPSQDALEETAIGIGDGITGTDELDRRLRVGRPEFGGALDELRARMTATAQGLASQTVGRYRLGRALGSGAFGTVYEADDPQLDRRVAVKVLRVRSEKETARALREAQLLATLSHPNIVQVFEVGAIEEGRSLYVVMELIEGSTLRKWVAEAPRSWREIVEVVVGAAQGLLAAHQAGIIHRDLKPENVLIGRDGRSRVIDFGLARPIDAEDFSTSPTTLQSLSSAQITATGQVMGTPAYMAPEVFVGTCTPLSDQYGLCVMLYEALYGERPFRAQTAEELRSQVLTREAELPADLRGVPPRIRSALLRGMRRRPEERFGALTELVAALEAGLRPPRSGWRMGAVVGAGGLLVAGLVVAGLRSDPTPVLAAPIDAAQEQEQTSEPGLEPAVAAEVAALETEASRLRALVTAAKLDEALTLSSSLLERARALGHGPTLVVLLTLRGQTQSLATDYEHAIPVLEEAYFSAEDQRMPLEAAHAASELIGLWGYHADEYDKAHRWKDHADAAFGRAGLDPRRHVPYMLSVAGLAAREGDQAGAIGTLQESLANLERDHRTGTPEHALLLRSLAREQYASGDSEAAVALVTEAVTIYDTHEAKGSLDHAAALDNLGVFLTALDRFEEALARHREALEIRKVVLGPEHLDLARSYGNMGRVLGKLGRREEAIEHIDHAIELFTARLGSGNSAVAMGYEIRGSIHADRGAEGREDALRDYDRAARIYDGAGVIYVPTAERVRAAIRELGGTPPPTPTQAIPP